MAAVRIVVLLLREQRGKLEFTIRSTLGNQCDFKERNVCEMHEHAVNWRPVIEWQTLSLVYLPYMYYNLLRNSLNGSLNEAQ